MIPPGRDIGAYLPCSALFLGAAYGFAHREYLPAVFLLLWGLLLIPRY